MRRASLAGITDSTLKSLTSPAICARYCEASNFVMRVMPERPATRLVHAVATSLPTGLMTPSPVTTTRRRGLMMRNGSAATRRPQEAYFLMCALT